MDNNHDPSWHDYQPDGGRIPDNVTHLRIGYMEYQQLLNGNATRLIELPQEAFTSHPNLKQVQIYLPGVSRIGRFAFSCCPHLEQVQFVMITPREEGEEEKEEENAPRSQLISIGWNAFIMCKKLKSVIGLEHATESLQEIGYGAFACCKSLENINFNLQKLQYLRTMTFAHSNALTILDLSKATRLTELQDETFFGCTALILLHLPPNILKIGPKTFCGCSSLEEIHLPPNLRSVGQEAFQKCAKLKSIIFPSSLQQIGKYCFEDCGKLSQVVLPSAKLPFLKTYPFARCESLSYLDLPNQVPRQEWPLVLEQFCNEERIAKVPGGIVNPKNRNTIVWNFLCQNMAQLFIEDSAATMSRRRPGSQL